jgi:hypothetical protein
MRSGRDLHDGMSSFRGYLREREATKVPMIISHLGLIANQHPTCRSPIGGCLFLTHILHEETPMRRSLFTIVTASVLLAGSGLAAAQTTTTTTTWTTDHGTAIREYSTTQKYTSFSDPALKPNVGLVLPGTVTLYPLPETMKVPLADTYSYSIINDRPVVVERTTRKVIHTWE